MEENDNCRAVFRKLSNKLQTLHFTKCLFEAPPIARFQRNCTTAVKKSRELETILLVSFSIGPSFHGLYYFPAAISLSDVKHLPFLCKAHQLIIQFYLNILFKEYSGSFIKTVNFKGFSSTLKRQNFIQGVFKEYSRSSTNPDKTF